MFKGPSPVRRTVSRSIPTVLAFLAAGAWPILDNALAGDQFPRDRIALPFMPAAMAEGPAALSFNPAALSADRNFALSYYHTYSDSSLRGNDAVYAALRGLGFAVEWYGADATVGGRSYTIGLATPGEHPLALGSSYQWRSSDDPIQHKSHFWSHGLWWRPSNRVALAAVVDNYNRMKVRGERSDARFVYSAACRFLEGRLTVGADWYQQTSEALSDGTYRLAVAWEVVDGLTVFSDLDKDRNYSFGGRVDLTNLFSGSHAALDRRSHFAGGVIYGGIHSTRRRPLINLRREVVHLNLSGEIPDRRPPRLLFGHTPSTTWDLIDQMEKARNDPSVRTVVLHVKDPQLGWARRAELRAALERMRAAGKSTFAYCEGTVGNGEYYLASAADRVIVPPVSTVDLIGLKSEVVFVTRLLDKLGITADLEHSGDYKTASDLVTRTEMSPAHRLAVNALLDDLDSCWIADISRSRNVPPDRVRGWVDHGPYVSIDARAAGMVDDVAYPDQLDSIVRANAGPIRGRVSQRQLARRTYAHRGWRPPTVAVICASGSITEGTDGNLPLWGETMGVQTIRRAMRRARSDRRVKAIVLRINSSGGSIFASDQIWREVDQTVGKKPIIVSFADAATSGAYYIACAADSIFALPNTITGSIGVISGKLDLSQLYDKIGLDREVLTRGRYADMYGSGQTFDSTERAVVRDQMMRAYQRFVSLVATGRDLSTDSVHAIGQGRVWSGVAAKTRGLVDRFADLHEAIAVAARMAGVKSGDQIELLLLPEPRWRFVDAGPLAETAPTGTIGRLLQSALSAFPMSSRFSDGDWEVRYELPYMITAH